MNNVNQQTGIRYGIVSVNNLADWVLDEIQMHGTDLNFTSAFEDRKKEILVELENDGDMPEDDIQAYLDEKLQEFRDNWHDDEPIHYAVFDGVECQTTWLGGALLLWVFSSPIITRARLCSPCVPNCGNLDNPDPDGYECYGLPQEWLRDNDQWIS